ncbi:MAG: hypothetical protein ACPG49_08080 [Chitinophagales bacterium]
MATNKMIPISSSTITYRQQTKMKQKDYKIITSSINTYIRLAYADSLAGSWTMYDGEIMPLSKSGLAAQKAVMDSGMMDILKYLSWTESIAMYKVGNDALKAWEKRNQQKIKSSPPTSPHIASPEVIIDEQNQKIRLYYHGVVEGSLQMSKVALSNDGIHFETNENSIVFN